MTNAHIDYALKAAPNNPFAFANNGTLLTNIRKQLTHLVTDWLTVHGVYECTEADIRMRQGEEAAHLNALKPPTSCCGKVGRREVCLDKCMCCVLDSLSYLTRHKLHRQMKTHVT